jgi:hypothetical protein
VSELSLCMPRMCSHGELQELMAPRSLICERCRLRFVLVCVDVVRAYSVCIPCMCPHGELQELVAPRTLSCECCRLYVVFLLDDVARAHMFIEWVRVCLCVCVSVCLCVSVSVSVTAGDSDKLPCRGSNRRICSARGSDAPSDLSKVRKCCSLLPFILWFLSGRCSARSVLNSLDSLASPD